MLLRPLNVRTTLCAVHVSRDSRHKPGAGPVGLAPTSRRRAPHGPGFRPMGWSCGDVALSDCSAAAWATVPGGARQWPIRAEPVEQKTKRPTRVVCAGGASKLLDSKERPTDRVSPFVCLRHYGLRVNLERSPTSSYSMDSRPRPTRASSSTAGRGPAVDRSGAKSRRRTWSY